MQIDEIQTAGCSNELAEALLDKAAALDFQPGERAFWRDLAQLLDKAPCEAVADFRSSWGLAPARAA